MKKLYGIRLELEVFDDCVDIVWGDFERGLEFTGADIPKDFPADGYHHIDDRRRRFIYIKSPDQLPTLVHELVHYVMKVCNERGIVWDDEDGKNEVVAYMMGSLVQQFASKYKKPKLLRKQKKLHQ